MEVPERLGVVEIKAFVSAKDFELSKQYYEDIGFTMASDGGGVAYFHFEHASFLLQDFCAGALAENFMMHMLVKDVEAWWDRVRESGVVAKYGVRLSDIEIQPWGVRDFCLTDPSGVLWRIGQNWPANGEREGEVFAVKIDNAREILQVDSADLSGSDFNNVKLSACSFVNVDMSSCTIDDVTLARTVMTNVNLTRVAISRANMVGMTIDGVLVSDLFLAYRGRGA